MSTHNLTLLIIAAIILFFGSLFLHLHFKQESRPASPETEILTEPEKAQPRVSVLVTGCSRMIDRVVVSGVVNNIGIDDLGFVTVKSIFKNQNNLIIETGIIYAVKEKPLKPGESVEFQGISKTSNVRKCNVEALDWW